MKAQIFFQQCDALPTTFATPAATAASPPVATVSTTAPTKATAPTVALAQFGNDQFPFTSKRLTGLLIQHANKLYPKIPPSAPRQSAASALINLPITGL